MLSLVRADGSSGPFPQEDRAAQRSLFIWFFHYNQTSLGLPNFPNAHKYVPGEMPPYLQRSDMSLRGRRHSVTLSQDFPSLPTYTFLCFPSQEFTDSKTLREITKEHGGALDWGSDLGCFHIVFSAAKKLKLNAASGVERVVREI